MLSWPSKLRSLRRSLRLASKVMGGWGFQPLNRKVGPKPHRKG